MSTRAKGVTLPEMSTPLAYLITWTCRGTWLHGDTRGSVDRKHNMFGTPLIAPDPVRNAQECTSLTQTPFALNASDREVVERAIRSVCTHRNWRLHDLAVRSNHVHCVLSADTTPERAMQDLKSWSTRALRAADPARFTGPIWTRHGSTRYLFGEHALIGAINYVRSHDTNPRAHARGSF